MTRLMIAAAVICAAVPAASQPTREEMQLPPPTYSDMTFLHPNGCLYARADAPGYARQWHAISNGNVFVAGARRGDECTTVLTQPTGTSR